MKLLLLPRRRVIVFAVYSALIISTALLLKLSYAGVSEYYFPSLYSLVWGVVAAFIMVGLRNKASRLVAHLWMAWYFIGSINTLSSYIVLGRHYRPFLDKPTCIYFCFTCAMFIGMLVAERLLGVPSDVPVRTKVRLLPLHDFLLAIFVLLFSVSLIYFARGAPILSGADITDDIYETNYGPLYGFALILATAALCFAMRMMQRDTFSLPILGLFLGACVASILDGKRYTLILILLGTCFLALRLLDVKRAKRLILSCVTAALGFYLAILVARQGFNTERYTESMFSATFIAGVEFRDFVYSVANFEPGSVPGYHWFTSATAAMGNQSLLSLVGVDKASLVQGGSAFSWSRLFDSPFGIRTGIVSELWFAYGWWGLGVAAMLGAFTAYAAQRVMSARSDLELINWSLVLALLTTSIMGQFTSISGSFTVVVYFNIAFYASVLILRFAPRARAITK